jgi:hypothetical protein
MEIPDVNPQQEYDQLMQIMDKKDWPVLNQNLHNPEVLSALMAYADAMSQRKQATNMIYESYLKKINMQDDDLKMERKRLSEIISRNTEIEEVQLKILTKILYGREIEYDKLLHHGYIRYFFE